MRELVYYVAVSIDGFIAEPDGTFDAFPVTGDHAAVLTSDFADAVPTQFLEMLGVAPPRSRFDTVIQGSRSYRIALDEGNEHPYAHLREYVATRSGATPPDGVTYTADPLATIRDLKQEDGLGIYLCGGGVLAGSLLSEIDQLVLKRYPIVLGDGIRMFAGADPTVAPFNLVSTRRFESGLVIEEYRRPDEGSPFRGPSRA
ncbi:Dihydrofolate reductase [Aeromicrobium choanae]|uniref:Dihydrofolate reductase n=2 Tax=Aeromicrobium choanae TaxID=1736691 RepID=A0A1T4Z8G3_9ACTN|nr:Dihydrofolate reductase [Aeromicrobium choanae]